MNATIARGLYLGLQTLRREPIRAALDDVLRTARISADALRQLQAERQLEQLRFALDRVPHYRKTLAPHADAIARARCWDDVRAVMDAIPVVEKAAVMETPAEFTADRADELPTHLDKTSGSSGTPVIFPCDQRAWAYRHALMFQQMAEFGVQIGEPYALFFGLHWNKKTRLQVALRDRILNRVRVSAYEIDRVQFPAHLAAVRNRRPTHLLGYPSAVYDFCVLAREASVDLRELRLKAVFLTSEPLRPHQRALIHEATGAPCADQYGSAEGGIIALECPAGGLHTTPEATWLQVRDTATHRGEAIVTDMTLRAFPMIRYAMGDEVVLRPGTCACGRAHPMLQSIEGRSGAPITLPNGRTINPNLPSYIFKPLAALGVIRRYRFVQQPSGALELLLVVSSTFQPAHLETVKTETAKALGADLEIEIHIVDQLPHLANAKHRDYVRLT